ncbi:3',5'-cyclic-AMP phosphodiesterase [Pseudoteredinibacter isoporae]|uniref:Icc protein n=1 Tax=Pseudoteredinibacter isoporae TaxID=570281 RepID=A0A7X0JR09_9GAMM|nr:Icc protein [Pseudoteredinibacter isoporae]
MILPINAERPTRILHITDCHLGAKSGETLLGLNVEASFVDVLEHALVREETPDLILVTGDIAGHASAEAYERFSYHVEKAFPNVPYVCVPGNHDTPSLMASAFPESALPRSVELGDWLIVLLDSTIPNCEHGNLCDAELDFLQQALADNRDKHIIVCMHHQPMAVGCDWIDQYQVASADRFKALVAEAGNVEVVLWGHIHQVFESVIDGVQYMASPSTCIQFKPNSVDFALDRKMPGYRWFELAGEGQFGTRVERISERNYPIDYSSNGY